MVSPSSSFCLKAAIAAAALLIPGFSDSLAQESIGKNLHDHGCHCLAHAGEKLPPQLPLGCSPKCIIGRGELSFGVTRSAPYFAKRAWQQKVVETVGEEFSRWEAAACRTVQCVQGDLAGTARCTYSAFACLREADREGRASRELIKREIAELQTLLRVNGYAVSADGQFSEETSSALIQWQQKNGVYPDGLATLENLELLKKRADEFTSGQSGNTVAAF